MQKRASEETEADGKSEQWEADGPYFLTLSASLNSPFITTDSHSITVSIQPSAVPISSSSIILNQYHDIVDAPPSHDSIQSTPSPLTATSDSASSNDARLSPIKVKVKKGRRHARTAAAHGGDSSRLSSEMNEPLLSDGSI